MRVGIFGATGRVGRALVRLAVEQGDEPVAIGRGAPLPPGVAAVVDFTRPDGTRAVAALAAEAGVPLVSGTTGLDAGALAALDAAAARVPVLWEPNMSLGVFVLSRLVARAAASLPGWDVEIVEAHHRLKVDAPSGTAMRLAESVDAGRRGASALTHGREGRAPRADGEIGMHAVRGGSVIGDHLVTFYGVGERVEIGHRADDRDVFARGALRAAAWIAGRAPGRYGLGDVLGVT